MEHGSAALSFVISTEAYPDFLLRAASDNHVCGFPQENRMILSLLGNVFRRAQRWEEL
jgi:hypothetical protein